jgi:myo-inositol-1(or 4)-monophosphatase
MKHPLTNKELKEIIKFSESTALKASKILISSQKKISQLKVSSKDTQGVASDADLASESLIIKEITKAFPEAAILAEEEAFSKFGTKSEAYQEFKKKELCFVIDPLDGTHNYLASMDYYAICIGLIYKGMPITGVVYRPPTDDCYSASLGNGSFKKQLLNSNKQKNLLQLKSANKLKNSMLVTGFATEKGVVFDTEFSMFKNIMGSCRGVRRMGSAALDLCFVAEGIFDGFWERGLAPWDVTAAGLICQEAGVKVSDYAGTNFQPFGDTILAARNPLHKNLQKMMDIGHK